MALEAPMGFEIEVKTRVKDTDHNRVGGLLSSHPGFVQMRSVCKDDIYWSRPEEGKKAFRTRFERIDGESQVLFTSKPSKSYDRTELNEEHEFIAHDVDRASLMTFFKSIGYEVFMLKKKEGYDFEIRQGSHLINAELLKVEGLEGLFLECEITFFDEPSASESEKAQDDLMSLLLYCGYREEDLEKRTYKSLLGYDQPEAKEEGELIIYTDGGCSGNPGPGGWAFAVLKDGSLEGHSGSEQSTTNNRMELTAVISALEHALSRDAKSVKIITDSQYVKNGISTWIFSWKRNGWKTSGKDPVKNQELWMQLDSLRSRLEVKWEWVKGHAGVPGNELCDSLVRKETEKWLK